MDSVNLIRTTIVRCMGTVGLMTMHQLLTLEKSLVLKEELVAVFGLIIHIDVDLER